MARECHSRIRVLKFHVASNSTGSMCFMLTAMKYLCSIYILIMFKHSHGSLSSSQAHLINVCFSGVTQRLFLQMHLNSGKEKKSGTVQEASRSSTRKQNYLHSENYQLQSAQVMSPIACHPFFHFPVFQATVRVVTVKVVVVVDAVVVLVSTWLHWCGGHQLRCSRWEPNIIQTIDIHTST